MDTIFTTLHRNAERTEKMMSHRRYKAARAAVHVACIGGFFSLVYVRGEVPPAPVPPASPPAVAPVAPPLYLPPKLPPGTLFPDSTEVIDQAFQRRRLKDLKPIPFFLPGAGMGWPDSIPNIMGRHGREPEDFPLNRDWAAGRDPSGQVLYIRQVEEEFISGRLPRGQAIPWLINVLDNVGESERYEAVESIGQYGPAGSEAIPKLIEVMWRDGETYEGRVICAKSLGQIGPGNATVIDALSRAARSNYYQLAPAAIGVLGDMGPAAHAAIPSLKEALASYDPRAQFAAYDALGKVTPALGDLSPGAAVHLLQPLTRLNGKQPDPGETSRAFQILGRAGRKVVGAVPVLVKILDLRAAQYYEWAAVETMEKWGPGRTAEEIRSIVGWAIGNGSDSDLRWKVKEILEQLGPEDSAPAVPLAEGLSHPRIEYLAAQGLTNLGSGAKPASDALVKALQRATPKSDRFLVRYLCEALANTGPGSEIDKRALVQLLHHNSTLRGNSTHSGAPESPAAQPGILPGPAPAPPTAGTGAANVEPIKPTTLLNFDNYDDASTRFQPLLFTALAGLGRPKDKALLADELDEIRKALGSGDCSVVAGAARAAGSLGPAAGELAPLLLNVLTGKLDDRLMDNMLDIGMVPYGGLRPDTPPQLDRRRHAIVYTSAEIEIVRALGKLGPAAAASIPTIRKFAEYSGYSGLGSAIRNAGKEALLNLGAPIAQPAPP